MRISFEVNVKAVLAVVGVVGLSVGSFYAGMRHQEHKDRRTETTDPDPYAAIAVPIKAGDTLIIPESEAADNEASWCKAHPNTKWTFAPATAEQIRNLPPGSEVTPISGGCDASGQVWVVNNHK